MRLSYDFFEVLCYPFQALNAALFYNNPDAKSYVSLVPTSAHTGDGMGDLISQVVQLTQTRLAQRLTFSEEMESMVLEVRETPGKEEIRSVHSDHFTSTCAVADVNNCLVS